MHRFTHILAIIVLASVGLMAQAQTFEGYIEAADQSVARGDQYNAFRLYAIAAEDSWAEDNAYDERIAEVYYKAGVAAYRATAYAEAEKYMVKLQNQPEVTKYTLHKYYIAQSAFRQGRYDQAASSFQQFLDEQPGAPEEYRSTALAQINDADWAIDAMANAADIQFRHMPEGINTPDSDVMYVRGPKGTRYFSSNNFEYKADSLTPQRRLSRIMKQTGENTAEALPESINIPNKNVAFSAFNKAMNRVYYSVCDFRNYDELICDLFVAEVGADGNWTNPRKLDINQAGYTTTQPNVGFDATSGSEYLFFSSDRPGGQGGMDIYRVKVSSDGTLGTVENVEKVNTSENDVSPFWYGPRQTLYLASDGRYTFGGLDIFKSYLIDGRFRNPINLGAPVNSAADDAYYTRFDDPDMAYVSSRKPVEEATYYSDNRDVCCYDIYEFTPDPRIDLQVLTFNKLNQKELEGVTVALYQETPSGPELVQEITNLEDNEFNFLVEPGGKYSLKATRDGFTEDLDEFDLASPELKDLAFIERRMYLNPIIKLDVFTFNNVDESELPGATVQLFEVADDGSMTLVKEITNPTGNDAHFDLEIGKRYHVIGAKAEFGKATTDVDLREASADQGGTIRRDLYLGQELEIYVIDGRTDEPLDNASIRLTKIDGTVVGEDTNPDGNDFYYTVNLDQDFILETSRDGYFPRRDTLRFTRQDLIDGGGKLVYTVPLFSDDIDKFLPFEVYFDNDHPDPDAYRSTTKLRYDETYFPYIAKEGEFKEEAVRGMEKEEAFLIGGDISQFFTQEVKAGWKQLTRFSDALIQHMQNGRSYSIALQGTASPRAPTEYNRRLSARRNMSLDLFFRHYKGGVLAKYLDSGKLEFVESALGETTANLDKIYSRIDRPRESVYSPRASIERRVSLVKATPTKKK
ncbi:hypothetical protein [Neolewinella agarilytica]|uniref:hypothetical protein n=1 Tax=Neolewinella agarilytica TaxID=478744 RepID=UPI0023525B14|nr:hypothetical protein [Neolewinella agarilytica]